MCGAHACLPALEYYQHVSQCKVPPWPEGRLLTGLNMTREMSLREKEGVEGIACMRACHSAEKVRKVPQAIPRNGVKAAAHALQTLARQVRHVIVWEAGGM